MQVSRVELVKKITPCGREHYPQPYTFFSLDAREQMAYNAFRVEHAALAKRLRPSRDKDRSEQEDKVNLMFAELILPYLQEKALGIQMCFTMYGQSRETTVWTPPYPIFDKDYPLSVDFSVHYSFNTDDTTLSCESYLRREHGRTPEDRVIDDLLERVVQEKEQDGMTFPIVDCKGAGIHFASTDHVLTMMVIIRDIILKIGPEKIKELNELYREYMRHYEYRDISDHSLQEKVFKETYERELEHSLLKAGFIEQKLTRIE